MRKHWPKPEQQLGASGSSRKPRSFAKEPAELQPTEQQSQQLAEQFLMEQQAALLQIQQRIKPQSQREGPP